MTVQFKNTVVVDGVLPMGTSIESLYNSMLKENKAFKEKQQSDIAYIFQMYYTTSEEKPLKWVAFDSTTLIRKDVDDTYHWAIGRMQEVCKEVGYPGFKVVCARINLLDPNTNNPTIYTTYCAEVWAPTVKVFVNGPKKSNDFLAKKGKHFV
jgi:hypothetical protein